MTTVAGLPLPIVKEIRALSLAWVACLVTMLAAAVLGGRQFRSLGVAAYFLGAAALGALAVGHEYSHGTLTLLLAQPARRQRVFLAKLGVLLALLLPLATVAGLVLFSPTGSFRGPRGLIEGELGVLALSLPVLCGLFVAPWLTMVSRNPIAGTVFSVGVTGVLFVSGELLGMAIYGRFASEVSPFRLAFFRVSMLLLCAIGAVMSWRTFMRLEAIDGRDPELRLPHWLRRAPSQRATDDTRAGTGRPVWLLVQKELHLHALAFIVAGLYVLGWLALVSLPQPDAPTSDGRFNVLSMLYGMLTALLIGALASAQERQLGTLHWQVMMPVPTSTQWAVKAGVVLGLTMLLGLGLPLLLSAVNVALGLIGQTTADIVNPTPAAVLMLFAGGALYVSSLSASGIQALLIAVATVTALGIFTSVVLVPVGLYVYRWSNQLTTAFPALTVHVEWNQLWALIARGPSSGLVWTPWCLMLALWFALQNHRSAERGAKHVMTQVMWIALVAVLTVVLWAALEGAIRYVPSPYHRP